MEIEKVRVAVRIKPLPKDAAELENHIIVEENNSLVLLPPDHTNVDYSELVPRTPGMPRHAEPFTGSPAATRHQKTPSAHSVERGSSSRKVTPTGLRYTPKSGNESTQHRRQSSLRFESTAMVTPARTTAEQQQERSVFAPSPLDPVSFSPVDRPLPTSLPRAVRRSSNVTGPQRLLFGGPTPQQLRQQKLRSSGNFLPPVTPAFHRGTPKTLLRNVVSTLTPRTGVDSPKTPASAMLTSRHQPMTASVVQPPPQENHSGEKPQRTTPVAENVVAASAAGSATTTSCSPSVHTTVSASMSAGHSSTVAGPRLFHFDHVFEPSATQECVFGEVAPYVDAVVRGFNATVFAYGPSGTGKTHTMLGTHFPAGAAEDLAVAEDSGVVPRSVQRLFAQIDAASAEREFTVSCTFVELYCDTFADLLDPNHGKRRLASEKSNRIVIREDVAAHSVFLSGSDHLCTPVNSALHTLELLAAGARRRNCTKTEVNDRSSRSHAIITLMVESRPRDQPDAPLQVGKLHLVDLAGSERLGQSKAEGVSKREACKINSSLSALGDVLSALSSERYTGPVPYRNSKLTRLLKDSLGGNSKTLFLVHVSDDAKDFRSNLVSLMYGQRARKIKNLNMVNFNRTHLKAALSAEHLNKQLVELQQILFERTKALHDLNEKELVFEQENKLLREELDDKRLEGEQALVRYEEELGRLRQQHALHMAEQDYEHAQAQMAVSIGQWRAHQLEVDLHRSISSVEQLRSAVAHKDRNVEKLQLAHAEAAAMRRRQETTLKRVESDRAQVQRQLEEARDQLTQLRKQHANAARALSEEQELEHQEAIEKLEALRQQLEQTQAELEEARRTADEEASEAVNRADELSAKLDEQEQELSALQETLAAKEEEGNELEQEVSQLREQLATLNAKFRLLQLSEQQEREAEAAAAAEAAQEAERTLQQRRELALRTKELEEETRRQEREAAEKRELAMQRRLEAAKAAAEAAALDEAQALAEARANEEARARAKARAQAIAKVQDEAEREAAEEAQAILDAKRAAKERARAQAKERLAAKERKTARRTHKQDEQQRKEQLEQLKKEQEQAQEQARVTDAIAVAAAEAARQARLAAEQEIAEAAERARLEAEQEIAAARLKAEQEIAAAHLQAEEARQQAEKQIAAAAAATTAATASTVAAAAVTEKRQAASQQVDGETVSISPPKRTRTTAVTIAANTAGVSNTRRALLRRAALNKKTKHKGARTQADRAADDAALLAKDGRENSRARANQRPRIVSKRPIGARKLQRELAVGRTPKLPKVDRRHLNPQTPLLVAIPTPVTKTRVATAVPVELSTDDELEEEEAAATFTPVQGSTSSAVVADDTEAVPQKALTKKRRAPKVAPESLEFRQPKSRPTAADRTAIALETPSPAAEQKRSRARGRVLQPASSAAAAADCFLSPATPAAARRAKNLARRKKDNSSLKDLLAGDPSNLLAAAF